MLPSFDRWLALARKESRQLRKNRQLLIQLMLPPTVAIVVFGFALNPEVKHLQVGVVDQSLSPASRRLLDTLTANQVFDVAAHYGTSGGAERALRHRQLDLVIVIPADLAERRARGETAEVQVWIDAVNANVATLAESYLSLAAARAVTRPVRGIEASARILYNPGSIHSWYFISGTLCTILFINATLVSAALTVREKELGTIEQLLMSPAQTLEVLLAKTTPIVLIMTVVFTIGMGVCMGVFGLPQRGNWLLLYGAAFLLVMSGVGVGVTLATLVSSQQQSQLLAFFLIPPTVLVSGAFGPVDAMPAVLRLTSVVDPVSYMVRIFRMVTLKGAGFADLWEEFAALVAFSVVLYVVSALRFRSQLR